MAKKYCGMGKEVRNWMPGLAKQTDTAEWVEKTCFSAYFTSRSVEGTILSLHVYKNRLGEWLLQAWELLAFSCYLDPHQLICSKVNQR